MIRLMPLLAVLPLLAAPAHAQTLRCDMQALCADATSCAPTEAKITFAIDRNQFAPPFNAKEPPRVKRTFVTLDGMEFVAEPFLFQNGAIRGFWTDAEAMGTKMLTAAADGSARYLDSGTGLRMTGHCREVS